MDVYRARELFTVINSLPQPRPGCVRAVDAYASMHEYEAKRLQKFMYGQTGTELPDGELGFYVHDINRWLGEGMGVAQHRDTWD